MKFNAVVNEVALPPAEIDCEIVFHIERAIVEGKSELIAKEWVR